MTSESKYTVRALDRGLAILQMLANSLTDLPVSLEAISAATELSEGTAYRILMTLEGRRFVQRDARGGYRLGVAAVQIGNAFISSTNVVATAQTEMALLVSRFEQTVNLGTIDGGDVVFLHRMAPPGLLGPMIARPGLRVPANCSGIGKACLAYQKSHLTEQFLTFGPFPAYTEHSLTDAHEFRGELVRIRSRGFATDFQELAIGVHSAAAPIFSADGSIAGGISVGGVRDIFTQERVLEEVGPAVAESASRITETLGGTSHLDRKDHK